MTLPEDQYSEDSIRLLAASNREYSKAKCVMRLRVVASILIALCGPIATYLVPAVTNYLAIAGGVWLLLSTVVLKRVQSALTKWAATIQEEFDTKLFDLPWNKMLIGDHESRELIRHADAKFKTERKVLSDWYSETWEDRPSCQYSLVPESKPGMGLAFEEVVRLSCWNDDGRTLCGWSRDGDSYRPEVSRLYLEVFQPVFIRPCFRAGNHLGTFRNFQQQANKGKAHQRHMGTCQERSGYINA